MVGEHLNEMQEVVKHGTLPDKGNKIDYIYNMTLSWEEIQVVMSKVMHYKDMYGNLRKEQLYEKLREAYEEKTGEDRSHLDSVVGLDGKRKLREYWRNDDYFYALALIELDMEANMFEYWSF